MTESSNVDEIDAAGPWLWVNWLAKSLGYPARDKQTPERLLLHYVWEEYTIFSDASVIGELQAGPYTLFPLFGATSFLGAARPVLVLRSDDHIPRDAQPIYRTAGASLDVERFVSGDLGDQVAWLLSLALGRRFRSWGCTRSSLDRVGVGDPQEPVAPRPVLEPDVGSSILPMPAEGAELAIAGPFFERFASINAEAAVAVVRAARLYADALWTSRADPAMAWLKLFGALECASASWDESFHESPAEQLAARRPDLVRALRKLPHDADAAIDVVAEKTSRMMGAESKLQAFVRAHSPAPPAVRPPEGARLDYSKLETAISVLYGHRSAELHGGIPFPPELCRAPHEVDGVATEVFSALASGGAGGHWPAQSLPMYLHTFVHVVGEVLRSWWLSLPATPRENGLSASTD